MMLIMFKWELHPALRRLECISFRFSPKCVIFMKNKNAACWDSGINLGVLPVWVQLKLSNVYFNSVFWGLFRRSRPQVWLSTIKSAGTSVEIFQVPIANVFVNIIWENHNVSFREKGCFLKRKIPLTVQFIPAANVFVVVVVVFFLFFLNHVRISKDFS